VSLWSRSSPNPHRRSSAAADFVITMGVETPAPIDSERRYMHWPVADPVALPLRTWPHPRRHRLA
jgi:hypothetical protein